MNEFHPVASPIAVLTPDNLRALLLDMGGEPGIYTAFELYSWYSGMAEEVGLGAMSKKAFGLALRDLGYRPSIQRRGGKMCRCWFISGRAWRS